MTKDKAVEFAQRRADRDGEPYAAVQTKKGQWVTIVARFLGGPIGVVLYPADRERVIKYPVTRQD